VTYLFKELESDGTAIVQAAKSVEVNPRPYQAEAVANVYREWDAGRHSVMIVSATGTGKSVMFSDTMAKWDVRTRGKIILMAHRRELIYQALGHASRAGLSSDTEMAGKTSSWHADVVVSTVQTLNSLSRCEVCRGKGCDDCGGVGKVRRFTKFAPEEYGLVVVDEAHHSLAESYRNVFAWFEQRSDWRRLLVTATPKRGDNKGMHNVCDAVALDFGLKQAIDDGWLVRPLQKFVTVAGLDLSKVSTKGSNGDLKDGELEQAFLGTTEEEDERLHSIARPTIEEASGRPFLVFAAGKDHAKKLTAAFNTYDDCRVGMIVDDTPENERRTLIDSYKAGRLNGLVNCMVFTEGFDAPKTTLIANCRPTKSEAIYLQIIGRATRPLAGVVDGPDTADERRQAIADSGKPHCIILDFVGNAGRHKLQSVGNVLAGDKVDPIDLEKALKIAKKEGETVDIIELANKVKQAREEREERQREAKKKREMTRHRAESVDYRTADVDLFRGDAWSVKNEKMPKEPASSKQTAMLRRLGYRGETRTLSKRQASGMIGNLIATKKIVNEFREKIATAGSMSVLTEVGHQLAKEKKINGVIDIALQPLRELYAKKRSEIDG
jgi:superfamily II DNA or RNA helicase